MHDSNMSIKCSLKVKGVLIDVFSNREVLYEFFRRKPGWRFTAGVQFEEEKIVGDLKKKTIVGVLKNKKRFLYLSLIDLWQ